MNTFKYVNNYAEKGYSIEFQILWDVEPVMAWSPVLTALMVDVRKIVNHMSLLQLSLSNWSTLNMAAKRLCSMSMNEQEELPCFGDFYVSIYESGFLDQDEEACMEHGFDLHFFQTREWANGLIGCSNGGSFIR